MSNWLKNITFGFLFFLFSVSEAQYSKTHYLPPTYNQNSTIQFSTITVTTIEEFPFDVHLTNASGSYTETFKNLSKENPITIELSTEENDGIFKGKEKKTNKILNSEGFILTADNYFFTSQIHAVKNQAAVIASKGTAGLGKEFFSGHLYSATGKNKPRAHFISVLASEDNTTITFENLKIKWEGHTNNTFNITLNEGESYVLAAPFNYINDLIGEDCFNAFNGTHVTSDKPIAMNSGSFLGSSSAKDLQDAGVDQIVPVNRLNTEFILAQGQSDDVDLELAMVIASEDNTSVYVNGETEPLYILKKGEYAIINGVYYIDKTMHIKTSSPTMVYQNLASKNSAANLGMVFVPGLMEDASRSVMVSGANKIGSVSLYIIAKKGEELTINGFPVQSVPIQNAGNSNWVTYRISPDEINTNYCSSGSACSDKGEIANFLIESTGPINAAISMVDGFVGAAGYFSGFAAVNTDVGVSEFGTLDFTLPCTRDTVSLFAKGADSYKWESPSGNKDLITKINDSTYLFDYNQTGNEGPFIYEVIMEATSILGATKHDTATVTVHVEFSPECIPKIDTFFVCEGQSILIEKENSTHAEWSGNEPFTKLSEGSIEASPTKSTMYYITRFTKVKNVLINGDFEEPYKNAFAKINDETVPGWSTTAEDRIMEFWNNGFLSTPAYLGDQFVELNANMSAALYQDMPTSPGTKLMWGFAHRGRNGEESMHFEIGPPNGPYARIETVTTGKEWEYYSGVYDVPNNQTSTRFYYSSEMPGSIGNLMDAVEFHTLKEIIDSVFVVVNPIDSFKLGRDTTICLGESLTINAGVGTRFNWSTNETTQAIDVTSDGTYGVTVTNLFNCSFKDSIKIAVIPCIKDHFDVDTLFICEGENVDIKAKGILNKSWGGTELYTLINDSTIRAAPQKDAYFFIGKDAGYSVGENIIINGDFESGSTGFRSDYMEWTESTSGTILRGGYYIGTNPSVPQHVFKPCADHTSGSGKMFITDAAEQANVKVWCQDIRVVKGLEYEFATWITSVFDPNPPLLQFQINNELLGEKFQLEETTCNWQKFSATWNSGIATSAEICLINQLTAGNGNDFAVDDISFAPIQPILHESDSIFVVVYKIPEIDLGKDTTICEGEEITFGIKGAKYFDWSNGISGSEITVSEQAEYSLTITDENSCENSDTVNLAVQNLPFVNLGRDTTFCKGDTLYLNAHNTDLNFKWNTNKYDQIIPISESGVYGVKVTDDLGCFESDSIEVIIKEKPIVELGPNQKKCEGIAIQLDAQNEGLFYNWNTGQATQKITLTQSGTYRVDITDKIGCVGTDEMELIVNPIPIIDLGNDTSFCMGESFTLNAMHDGLNFEWSSGETTQEITVNAPGEYKVIVADEIGCADSSVIKLTVNKLPIVHLGNDQEICEGDSISLNAQNDGLNYKWNSGENTQKINVNISGDYQVVVFDNLGCADSSKMKLSINPLPTINLEDNQTICKGESLTLNAQNSGYNYKWNTGESTQKIEVSSNGNYQVIVFDEIGCADTALLILTVNELPVVNLGNDQVFCENESVQLNAQNDGHNYTWNTGEKTQEINVNTSGDYQVIVFDDVGCADTSFLKLTVNKLPVVDLGKDQIICRGESIILNAQNNGFKYTWNTGENTQKIEVNSVGNYQIFVFDDIGCADTASINLTVNELPVVNLGNDQEICGGETIRLNAQNTGFKYKWNTGSNSKEIDVHQTGDYQVIVFDEVGCADTSLIKLTVHALPVVNLGKDQTICQGESVLLDAQNNGFKYKWSTGAISEKIIVFTSDNYEVFVFDALGCADTSNLNITVNELPTVNLGEQTILCDSQNIILDAGNQGANFLWNKGSKSQTIKISEEGFYRVEVRDEVGCLGRGDILIVEESIEDPYLEKEKNICEGTSIILEPDFSEDYNIYWELDVFNSSMEVSETGSYASIVESEHCRDTFLIHVTKIDTPNAKIRDLKGQDYYCFNIETTILEVLSDDPIITNVWDDFGRGEDVEIEKEGTYAVNVYNEFCSSRLKKTMKNHCKGIFYVPKAFTPGNNDGLNDIFMPVANEHVDGFDFKIFNRWGTLIYSTKTQGEGWDGRINGSPAQIDIYSYRLSYSYPSEYDGDKRENRVGSFTLLR